MSTKKNDKVIADYRKKVEAKRKALGSRPRTSYVTNASLPINGTRVNLNTLQSVSDCVETARQIAVLVAAQDLANEWMDTSETLKLGDYTVQEWVDDLKMRKAIIEWNAGKRDLDAADKQLAELLSNEAKTANAITSIVDSLDI